MLKKYPEIQIVVPRFNEANGFYTTKKRSELMGRIRSTNTKPELILRKTLWNLGFRYRKNVKKLPGTPDIVYVKQRLAVFIDGGFWHGYDWETKKSKIKSNSGFWIPKIERNMQRDRENNQLLYDRGWYVIRFWDHEIKNDLEGCVNLVINYLTENV